MPTVTKPRSTGRRRREEVSEQVLAAVERLIADGHSYTELPVQRIAEEAGIARSTFYVHFPDKAQLLIRLAEIATRDLFQAAEGWWLGDHRYGPAGVAATMERMVAGFRAHDTVLLALVELAGYEPEV